MPTDPTARDVETARRIAGCRHRRFAEPSPNCVACRQRDAIARALATARAEEREACARVADAKAKPARRLPVEDVSIGSFCQRAVIAAAQDIATAIRAREGADRGK